VLTEKVVSYYRDRTNAVIQQQQQHQQQTTNPEKRKATTKARKATKH